jgi:hypothetical protein
MLALEQSLQPPVATFLKKASNDEVPQMVK